MKSLILALCLTFASFGINPVHAAESVHLYFSALPELPIPANMHEDEDSAVRFDQPEGRIITLQASGSVKPNEITDFYTKTLPSLGWTFHPDAKSAPGTGYYSRGAEVLLMEIRPSEGGISRLNVLLRPR